MVVRPPNVKQEVKIPVTWFSRSSESGAISFYRGDTLIHDLPPGGYVVYRADEPQGTSSG